MMRFSTSLPIPKKTNFSLRSHWGKGLVDYDSNTRSRDLPKKLSLTVAPNTKRTIGEVAKKENHVSHSCWELISKHLSVE
jgi:hypothetical protein